MAQMLVCRWGWPSDSAFALLSVQDKPAIGLVQAVMRMAYCWTLDADRTQLHAIIARLSVRDRSRYFVLEVTVHAYARPGAVPTSLAAKELWQLVDLRLVKGEPEDVVPEVPITERRVVSSQSCVDHLLYGPCACSSCSGAR
jgi:hypothetical protein